MKYHLNLSLLTFFLLAVDATGSRLSAGESVGAHHGVHGRKRGQKDVYLAVRDDGKVGNGSKSDPYDASTPKRYTALLTALQPNYTLHYEPGVYETYGWYYRKRKTAGFGCKHFGAGIDQTTIRLVGAAHGTEDGCVFGADIDSRSDGFEVHDITIDCNAIAQPKWNSGEYRSVTGIGVRGSNIAIQKVKVVHFGTKSVGTECFPIFVFSNALAGVFENCVVEDCIVTSPAIGNLDGVSSISVGVSAIGAKTRDMVARNNRIDLTGCDFLYSHGLYAPLIEGNFVKGCSDGVYNEPPFGGNSLVIVRNNQFVDCQNGVSGLAHKGSLVDGYRIENNNFTDCNAAVSIRAIDDRIHYREITVRGNRYHRTDGARNASGSIHIAFTKDATVIQNVLDDTTSWTIHVKATTSTVRENRTSKGVVVN